MKSYLDGRQQCVQIDGVISDLAELACGVPQGSVLGRLKLYIYMCSGVREHSVKTPNADYCFFFIWKYYMSTFTNLLHAL